MRIVNAFYTIENNQIIMNFIIQNNKEKKLQREVSNILPYFFTKEFVKHEKILRTTSLKAMNGIFFKHEVAIPAHVREVKEELEKKGIETFEADVKYVYRYIIDNKISLGDEPLTKLYIDIETYSTKERMSDANKDRILCIACIDENNNRFYFDDEDERQLLLKFFRLAKKYSLILAYWGSEFDFPYIEKRARILKLDNEYKSFLQWCQLGDPLKMYKYTRLKKPRHYSLSYIAETELNSPVKKMSKEALFSGDKEKLKEYVFTDVELLKFVDERLQLSTLFDNFARLANVFFSESKMYAMQNNYVVLAKCFDFNGKRYVLKNKPSVVIRKEERKEKLGRGGFVMTPEKGLHKFVLNFDFSSHYPNIIKTFNISWDKKDENGEILLANGIRIKKERGIYPSIIDEMLAMKKDFENKMKSYPVGSVEFNVFSNLREATKYRINSCYGFLYYEGSRVHDKDLAEGITLTGQELVKKVVEIVKGLGYKVCYADTDSCYVETGAESLQEAMSIADWLQKEINEKIKNYVLEKFNVPEEYYSISIDLNSIYEKILFLPQTKKRYCGIVVYKKGQQCNILETVGLESVRSDTCPLAVEVQNEVIKMILTQEGKEEEIKNYLLTVKKKLFSGELDEKLIISKTLSKLPTSYKSPPLHVQVISQDKSREYFIGDKISFYVVGRDREGRLRAVPAENNNKEKPDYNYYWENLIYPAMERIILAVYPNFKLYETPLSKYVQNSTQKKYEVISKEDLHEVIGFVCVKCSKQVRRPSLTGRCFCGGTFLFVTS